MKTVNYISGKKGRDGDYEITIIHRKKKIVLSGFSYSDMVERIKAIENHTDPEYKTGKKYSLYIKYK